MAQFWIFILAAVLFGVMVGLQISQVLIIRRIHKGKIPEFMKDDIPQLNIALRNEEKGGGAYPKAPGSDPGKKAKANFLKGVK